MKLNDDAQKNLRQHAASFDVNPDRIIFADRVPTLEEHLERYLHADLCLDTFPYNGHTTTFDALSIGVPVITLQGQAFQSRVASSLLNDYGQAEYIAGSYAEYQTTAQSLASKIASARFKKPHLENTKDIESKVSSLANLLTGL
jgi:predicted O-linked N-acetylglucosamine transferase (SPINDLY family)